MIKATWLWDTYFALNNPEHVITFCKQNSVNHLFLQISKTIPYDQYEPFMELAAYNSIEVHALNGDPHWALTSYQNFITNFLDWVKGYNAYADKGNQFKGIHVDIEPYLLSEWKLSQSDVIAQWMSAVQYITSEAKSMNLLSGAALTFWLDGKLTPTGEKLSNWMIQQYDYIALMSYRNVAEGFNGVLSLVADEINYANTVGKNILVGLETKVSSEGDNISFYNKGKFELDKQVNIINNNLSVNPSYAGIAIHDIESWRDLKYLKM